MSRDVDCPYCGKPQEINHDDGYGYGEGDTYNQECGDCGNTFAYTTMIHFTYSAAQAPCLNGAPHKMRSRIICPSEFAGERCDYCGYETPLRRALAQEVQR